MCSFAQGVPPLARSGRLLVQNIATGIIRPPGVKLRIAEEAQACLGKMTNSVNYVYFFHLCKKNNRIGV